MQTHSNTLTLTIEKYNFYAPVFIYPKDGDRVFLSKVITFIHTYSDMIEYISIRFQSQNYDTTLILYNEEKLPLIQADDQQNGKWDITFSIEAGDSRKIYYF